MVAEPKTRPTGASVPDFIAAVEHPKRRADAEAVCALMGEVSGEPAVMWGPSIVGFGAYRGPTGDWPRIAFSPRKDKLALYVKLGEAREDFLARLPGVKTGGGCLYVSDLAKLDRDVVRQMVQASWDLMARDYPPTST